MFKKIIKYILWTFLLLILFFLISLSFSYKNLKQVTKSSLNAKIHLETGINLISQKDWREGQSYLDLTEEELNLALNDLDKIQSRKLFKRIKILNKQLLDLRNLLEVVQIINSVASKTIPILSQIDNLYSHQNTHRFSDLSDLDKHNFFKLLFETEPDLIAIESLLEIAQFKLSQINKRGLLRPIYGQISELSLNLDQALNFLGKGTPLMKLLPSLVGFPDPSQFLIIMHNTDELRPSGGFIGVYGLLKTEQGEISQLETHDSYHLDMPAVGHWFLEPPAAIKKYMKVENWYLRDSNWSPDWPSSARQIQEIYRGESLAINRDPENFSGVIGISPDFVSALLELVGPIEMAGEIYDANNLQELLQYTVEVSYLEQGVSEWDRKNVINDILAELKDRLLSLKAKDLPILLSIFDEKIKTKDIQIYFNDQNKQALIGTLGIDGAVKKDELSDYLLVVDANLAAFKTDSVVEKNISYDLISLSPSLPATAHLSLEYKHNGGFDWRTTRYRSYTRVYLPLGTKLNKIKASGQANLESESISSYDDLALNKTVIAFFFSVEPGNKGAIEIEYDLPDRIKDDIFNKNYSLLAQRQAGRRTNLFKFILNNESKFYSLDKDILISPYAD